MVCVYFKWSQTGKREKVSVVLFSLFWLERNIRRENAGQRPSSTLDGFSSIPEIGRLMSDANHRLRWKTFTDTMRRASTVASPPWNMLLSFKTCVGHVSVPTDWPIEMTGRSKECCSRIPTNVMDIPVDGQLRTVVAFSKEVARKRQHLSWSLRLHWMAFRGAFSLTISQGIWQTWIFFPSLYLAVVCKRRAKENRAEKNVLLTWIWLNRKKSLFYFVFLPSMVAMVVDRKKRNIISRHSRFPFRNSFGLG